jgi:hypothetical protein
LGFDNGSRFATIIRFLHFASIGVFWRSLGWSG